MNVAREVWVGLVSVGVLVLGALWMAGPIGVERDAVLEARARLLLLEAGRRLEDHRARGEAPAACGGESCAGHLGLDGEARAVAVYHLGWSAPPGPPMLRAVPTRPDLPTLTLGPGGEIVRTPPR